jgi:hypothetical protein
MPLRYEDRQLSELRELAAARGLKDGRAMRKSELIDALRGPRKVKYAPKSTTRNRGREEKYENCVKSVKSRGGRYNPYAVCQSSIYGQ